ncbi:MAG TPA: PAS domain S-box protein [Candidatus Acidoferrales bacterium]|nr:PAS domain S-box protein [Candidatus Acidoferrales bacterium]
MLRSLQQRVIAGGFILAAAVLAVLFSIAYRSNTRFVEWNGLTIHTRDVLRALDDYTAAIKSAQVAAVDYYTNGSETQVQVFTEAESKAHSAISHVRNLVQDSAIQERNLDALVPLTDQALGLFREVIDLRRQGKTGPDAMKPVNAEAKKITPPLTHALAALTGEENRLLEMRSAAAAVAARRAVRLQLIGGIIATGLVLAVFVMFLRENSIRAGAENQLAQANSRLEERVNERTGQLEQALAQVRKQSEEPFRLFVSNVKDYALLMLGPEGRVATWNVGAERIKGYSAEEIVGHHFSRFYTQEDVDRGKPAQQLAIAAEQGRLEDEGWRVRKDGSRFWANVVMTALRDQSGALRGFGTVTRDMTERKVIEEEMAVQNAQLESANGELEAFCYSVSHDLRAPLRGIDGFSQALLEDYGDQLDDKGKEYLQRVRAAVQRMGALIDDLLNLSRITRGDMRREPMDLSQVARSIADELRTTEPNRTAEFVIAPRLQAQGDPRLMRVVLENLLRNAWKFTSKRNSARIEFGRTANNGHSAFFVKDNGAGFDPNYSSRLFGAFQRLHSASEFPGTGVGLATVQRIILRHGGKVWAQGDVNLGATFFFEL